MISRMGFRVIRWGRNETSETMSCLQRFLFLSQMLVTIYTNNHKEFVKACQVLQWNLMTQAPLITQDTNGVAERAVCRVTEGKQLSLSVQSGTTRRTVGPCDGNAHVTCAPCRTRWQMTRQHSRRYIARGLTDHQFFSEYWLRWSHFPRKTNQEHIILEGNR